MIFHQFEIKGLAHYSYALGCKEECEVAIIDPERNIKAYIEFAAENRLKIAYVLETHIHADYASGARDLAQRTGATLLLSAYDAGEKYDVSYPHKEFRDGDSVSIGKVKITALHTPGHTPEHLSFLVHNTKANPDKPYALMSGDFLFINSLGRPDLLGEGEKVKLANQMYESVQKLKTLPDDTLVFPGHGAGSLCGAGLARASQSTLGDQRRDNPFLQPDLQKDEFVKLLLANLPPRPGYYLRMKEVNSKGAPLLEELEAPKAITPEEVCQLADDAQIVDTRHPLYFGGGHIPGSINFGEPNLLPVWGPWMLDYEKPVYLLTSEHDTHKPHMKNLYRVGIDNVKGYVEGGISRWAAEGNDFTEVPQASVLFLHDLMQSGEPMTIIDVRSRGEWDSGHIKGARHMCLTVFKEKMGSLQDKEALLFVVCGGGYRSSLASSILVGEGFEQVMNVFGGMAAWKAAGLPTE